MRDVQDLLLPHIRRLNTYQGVDPMEVLAEQAGIPPEKVIRLNGNENPYGHRVFKKLGVLSVLEKNVTEPLLPGFLNRGRRLG